MKDIELDKDVSENLNVLKAEHAKLSGEVNNVVTSIWKAIPIAIIDPKWKLGHSKGALLAAQVLLGISMLLAACGPQSTAEISPSSTAPAAAETAGVADGIESPPTPIVPELPTLTAEQQQKFDKAGIDLTNMANAKYDKDGLHITLKSGEVLLTNEELKKRIHNGQDNVLQYRDKTNKNVIYAFDKETKTFLEASKYIQKDKTNAEGYIKVNSWDELKTVWSKEKMFLIPFDPENTYFPESKDINRNYLDGSDNSESFYFPFGKLPEGMDSPFNFVNFVVLEKDESANRLTDTYIITEQVYNPDDKSFSTIHLVYPTFVGTLAEILEAVRDGRFFLPKFKLKPEELSSEAFKVLIAYYKENDLIGSDGIVSDADELVIKWFDNRHVPEKLENIPFKYRGASIN